MRFRHCFTWAAAVLLCFSVCLTSLSVCFAANLNEAKEPIDFSKPCSLRLTYRMPYQGVIYALSGMEIEIFKAITFTEDGKVTLCGAFSSYPVRVEGISSQSEWGTVASTLNAYCIADSIPHDAVKKTAEDGSVMFDGLTAGIYLVRWTENVMGNHAIGFAPFLISVPNLDENGHWDYQIDALPKPGKYQDPEPPETEPPETEPPETEPPETEPPETEPPETEPPETEPPETEPPETEPPETEPPETEPPETEPPEMEPPETEPPEPPEYPPIDIYNPPEELFDLFDPEIPLADLYGYEVEKQWLDEDHSEYRPDFIEIELYCDGEYDSTVILSDENDWYYSWIDHEPREWMVVERDVPENYTVFIEEEDGIFIITNCTTIVTPVDRSPKTGVNYNIAPGLYILDALAVLLVLLGVLLEKKKKTDGKSS